MAPPLKPLRELAYVPLADVVADTTFRLRHPGDVSSLARSIAQVGQLFPVEVRETEGGLQALTGFRRLEALRLLQRNRVLVRNHGPLADDVAAVVAVADAIDNRALGLEDLRELHDRYVAMGWGTPALLELVSRSIEKEGERLEDLTAKLRGEAPPDRTIADEDAAADDEDETDGDEAATSRSLASEGDAQSTRGAPDASSPSVADQAFVGEARTDASPGPEPLAPPGTDRSFESSAPSEAAGRDAGQTRIRAPVVLAPLPAEPPEAPRLGVRGSGAVEIETQAEGVTADALARQLAELLSGATQDLAVLAEHWNSVPSGLRVILADQLDYYGRLADWLGPRDGDET